MFESKSADAELSSSWDKNKLQGNFKLHVDVQLWSSSCFYISIVEQYEALKYC